MKTIFLIILCLLPFLGITQTIDTTPPTSALHLKSGGHLLGHVYRRNTLQTTWVLLSGDTIVLPGNAVLKITKGNKNTTFSPNGKKLVQKGYYGTFVISPLFFFFKENIPSELNSILTSVSSGYRFHRYLAIGLGAGLSSPNNHVLLPSFLEVRGNILNRATTPTYNLKFGYGIPLDNEPTLGIKSVGGRFIQSSVGLKLHTKNKLSWLINIGYEIQQEKTKYSWNERSQKWTYRHLILSFGIEF